MPRGRNRGGAEHDEGVRAHSGADGNRVQRLPGGLHVFSSALGRAGRPGQCPPHLLVPLRRMDAAHRPDGVGGMAWIRTYSGDSATVAYPSAVWRDLSPYLSHVRENDCHHDTAALAGPGEQSGAGQRRRGVGGDSLAPGAYHQSLRVAYRIMGCGVTERGCGDDVVVVRAAPPSFPRNFDRTCCSECVLGTGPALGTPPALGKFLVSFRQLSVAKLSGIHLHLLVLPLSGASPTF